MTKLKWLTMVAVFALGLALAPSAGMAQVAEICTDGQDNDKDGATDCDDPDCIGTPDCKVEPPKGVCHNIGGPDDLGSGANCDPTTGSCTIEFEEGTLTLTGNEYFGIVISNSDNSAAAHLKHGDGFAARIFDPPLHLASEGERHDAANVECLGIRAIEQPEEPGN